ncbi:hypothetical protein [Thalassospira xiamenensis]|uniref:Uncharacterized protein n=1 Tax=Thalassospira xiamenensis TaxID=220697 RepID=A0A367XGC8_9PROT|nr:hypothetical protein [Thalassospira xiamenensis]KZB57355.1 hypothetical protein AUP41_11085 [Thalassospira xiamenensis]MCK2167291.1 hypothetical protein [Thalassospira xiamenensis]RCK52696.1 hypothetical protein TH44_00220 [Thalassospira xiamenensis]
MIKRTVGWKYPVKMVFSEGIFAGFFQNFPVSIVGHAEKFFLSLLALGRVWWKPVAAFVN